MEEETREFFRTETLYFMEKFIADRLVYYNQNFDGSVQSYLWITVKKTSKFISNHPKKKFSAFSSDTANLLMHL